MHIHSQSWIAQMIKHIYYALVSFSSASNWAIFCVCPSVRERKDKETKLQKRCEHNGGHGRRAHLPLRQNDQLPAKLSHNIKRWKTQIRCARPAQPRLPRNQAQSGKLKAPKKQPFRKQQPSISTEAKTSVFGNGREKNFFDLAATTEMIQHKTEHAHVRKKTQNTS